MFYVVCVGGEEQRLLPLGEERVGTLHFATIYTVCMHVVSLTVAQPQPIQPQLQPNNVLIPPPPVQGKANNCVLLFTCMMKNYSGRKTGN